MRTRPEDGFQPALIAGLSSKTGTKLSYVIPTVVTLGIMFSVLIAVMKAAIGTLGGASPPSNSPLPTKMA